MTLSETAAQSVNDEAKKGENDWIEEGDEEAEGDATDGETEGKGSPRGIR